ncbi:DUF11 domain-containing protein [Chryseobacterium paludis]|uniref:DUF11 domain-containing protein n=1 Tax=Chryseobacterium paludis TaxID=2956784 RepID=UPI0021C19F1E|nr:DUF11 domain-containing protein [Chryseobacterium paludis]
MKNNKTKKYGALLFIFSLTSITAQNSPNLEYASVNSDGNPTGNGPVTTTTLNFVKNTNNPSGSNFVLYSPGLSATFTISNQQYSNAASIGSTTNGGSAPIFPLLNSAGSPPNNSFSSSGAQAGEGINTSVNRGVNLFLNGAILGTRPTNATYYMADLTITFNRPVDNPILHIGGMGGFQETMGITAGFEYLSSNVPVSFSRLSGNSNSFSVTSTTINNSASNPNSTGTASASGSVLVSGTGIGTLKLKLTFKGTGGASRWQNGVGDQLTLGISALESDLSITKMVDTQSPNTGTNVNFTLTAQNKGASNNSNVSVTDLLPNGYTFISASTNTGTYNSSSGIWNIGTLNDGVSALLTITALVNCDGNYTNTASIIGNLRDPNTTNNNGSVTPTINNRCVCYNDANTDNPGIDSKFGITLLKRAGENWPMVRKSAHLVMESNSKGFVITRMAKSDLSNITVPVEGMLVYDTTDKCLKIYSDSAWQCFSKPACN